MTKSFPKIYTAKKKDILKINNFNNNYFYKKKRNIEQFNWLFKSKFNNIKNYYYAKKNNKISLYAINNFLYNCLLNPLSYQC